MPARTLLPLLCLACAAAPVRDDAVGGDGELRTATEVGFVIRPLDGPGTKGPHEVAPESEPALEQVAAWLAAHPRERLRVECAINPILVDGNPHPSWGAQLASLVARRLVARGVPCERLAAVGVLAPERDAPIERIRFFVEGRGRPRPVEAAADPCAD
jgi:hypothetical protein